MRIKSRLLKKVKIHKAKDEKVPVAWELGREIPILPYKHCLEIEDLCEEFVKLVHFKISESEEVSWCCPPEIEPIKFEHATVHNVDFEWGTFGRPFRYTPQVRDCPRIDTRLEVKVAEEFLFNYETLVEFETQKTTMFKATKITTGKKEDSFELLDDSELIESLSYNQQMFDGCERNPFGLKNLQFKISEEIGVCWGLEFYIPDVIYEHAVLQNVEFEWGTWSRPVLRQKPDVRGKEVGTQRQRVRKAKKEIIRLEEEETLPLQISTDYYHCVPVLYKPDRGFLSCVHPDIREDKDDKSYMIYKNTKYYCKQCDGYICNGCLSSQCFNHDVQWIGNSTFVCEGPHHRPNNNIQC